MNRIAVFFDQPNFDDHPFNKENYRCAYHDFARIVAKKDGELIITRGDESYLGKMKFKNGWRWNGKKFEKINEKFKVDVIYYKSNYNFRQPFDSDPSTKILNPKAVAEICDDKFKTYQAFPDLCPKTFLARNETGLKKTA